MIGIVLSENVFFYFYFLIVHISLNIYIIYLKPLVLTTNIAIEGTVSQIFYIPPHSYFIKCRKLDREKYSLSFGVSYVEIPALVTEILVFHQGCTSSPVSILKGCHTYRLAPTRRSSWRMCHGH